MIRKNLNFIIPIILLLFFLIYFYSCIKDINHNKNFINMILNYYPGYEVIINDSDPNSLLINIKKGD